MKKVSLELKVGIFAIIVLVILSFMTFRIGGFEWIKKRTGYIVYVDFKNIAGLDAKTKVKIAGVDAGVIERITLSDGRARLVLRMYPEVRLYSDASAAIKATGLLGDKFLAIDIGSKEPVLREGDTIKNVREVVDIDDMARNLSEVSANINKLAMTLNESLGSEEAKRSLKEAIVNLEKITSGINTAVSSNDRKIRDVLDNIKELTASINELVKDNRDSLKTAMNNFRDFSGSLKEDGPSLISNLNKATKELKAMVEENRSSIKETVDSVKNITARIDSGEGTLGKLVKDEKLYQSLNKAAEGVNRTISSIERFRTFITFQGEYLSKPKDGKGYFYVTLQPRPEKYYILGVVSDPIGKVKTTETTTSVNGVTTIEKKEEVEKKIEFTAQIARRLVESDTFKDTVLRAGVTENTFGIGVDQFFLKDRLKVSVDAWDFGRDEANARNPHVKVGADYFLFKHLFISGGIDNIFNKKYRGAYLGGGVRFEDEDFKYIFGTVPKIPGQ
jgi:phospholipid/cholesterol/gamma-HCH transport system substrate-binding protein